MPPTPRPVKVGSVGLGRDAATWQLDLGITIVPVLWAHAGMLHHFEHDGAKLLGCGGKKSIPGLAGEEKDLHPPPRASLQLLTFLWVFYCALGPFGPWLTIPWAGNSLCSSICDMAFLVG